MTGVKASYILELDTGHRALAAKMRDQVKEIVRKRIDYLDLDDDQILIKDSPRGISLTLLDVDTSGNKWLKTNLKSVLISDGKLEFWETYESIESIAVLIKVNDSLGKINLKDSLARDSARSVAGKKEIKHSELEHALEEKFKADGAKLQDNFGYKNPVFSLLSPAIMPSADGRGQTAIPGSITGTALEKDTQAINNMILRGRSLSLIPPIMKFVWGRERPDRKGSFDLYVLRSSKEGMPALNVTALKDIHREVNHEKNEISMAMNPPDAYLWAKITRENIGKCIAISIFGKIASAPRVYSEIPNGRSSITGNFSMDEIDYLVAILKSGAYPCSVTLIRDNH